MVSTQEGWDSGVFCLFVFVEAVEPYTACTGRSGVQCPEQRVWNHVMPIQERVETSFPGTEDVKNMCYFCGKHGVQFFWYRRCGTIVSIWEWIGSSFPRAEDVVSVQNEEGGQFSWSKWCLF